MAMVCVWIAPILSGDVGHSSLLLDKPGMRPVYISWWPADGHKVALLPGKSSTKGHLVNTYRKDIVAECQRHPTKIISIDFLDEVAIAQWWRGASGTGDYSILFRNCSTIVMEALRRGGSSRIWPCGSLIDRPEGVLEYAEILAAAGKDDRMLSRLRPDDAR
jgi:hypothetical protein